MHYYSFINVGCKEERGGKEVIKGTGAAYQLCSPKKGDLIEDLARVISKPLPFTDNPYRIG